MTDQPQDQPTTEEKATKPLKGKQRKFVDHYFGEARFNAAKAARLAGYSETTARQIGYENLTKPDIKAEIERRFKEVAMGQSEALARLADIARGDMADFADVTKPADLKDNPNSHLVKKMKVTGTRRQNGSVVVRTELELYPADSALQLILRHHGAFNDKVDHSGKIEITDGMTDDQRAARIAAILAKAQQRGDGHGSD